MAATRAASLAAFVFVLLLHTGTGLQSADTECAFSDQIQGAEPHSGPTNELRGAVTENGTVRCSHGSRCYGLWKKRPDGEIQLVKQGCWTHIGSQEECRGERCLVSAPPSQVQNGSYRFCCCSRDLCNVNFTEAPPTAGTPALRLMKTDDRQAAHQPLRREESALIALVTVAIAAIAIIALFLGYRMMKGKKKQRSLSVVDVMEANADAAVELDNLKLLELIGRGRYGTVFRGCLNERCVAVKLFSSANRQNYANERSIYSLPLLQQHDNIARFLSADERTTVDGRPEFLIIMDFYPNGCLSRYLSVHTVDWSTCCRMTHGVTRGLAFLHNELYRGDQYKPAVAHRDVSSRNVLVRADLSCVLADFGLSMRLTGSRPCCPGDDDTMAISEVGTVRYMAPEVLGGALNLRDCEAALKQVDVYALGLLLWESFRRCSHLFPGEAVPEYELAFQAELGNHPSFEEMQILVAREKFRPRFPEVWKKNSLVLRSLKETMEDCWDQDAEARLTAQCTEERLSELGLLNTHIATHNHRNLSHCSSSIHVSSTPTYIADHQVGVVNCLQGESQQASAIKTTTSGAEPAEKNRNCINQEQQQRQTLACSSHSGVLCSVSELENGPGGAGISVPICLQLTEEDLEPTKVDPKQVDKNLRKSSDENLKELPQKHFGSTEIQTSSLLSEQILQTAQANKLVLTPQFEPFGGADPPRLPRHPLPKQQNLPLRPTSLHLLSKAKESPSASSQLRQGKSNHRQVETGVAKMNTVTINRAVEPHLVTTVSNSIMSCGVAAVPSLITNGMIVGGQSNPAGPLLENEDTLTRGVTAEEDNCLNLFNFSPDEHQPLLHREQLPAETTPTSQLHHQPQFRAGNVPPTQGSNSNNNNNRTALGSHIMFQGSEAGPESWSQTINHPEPEPHLPSQHISTSSDPLSCVENKVLLSNPGKNIISSQGTMPPAPPTKDQGSSTGPCVQKASFIEPVLAPPTHRNPKSHLVQSAASSLVPGGKDADCGSASKASVQEPLSKNQNILPLVVSGNMDPKNFALESEDQEIAASVLELQSPALVPQGSAILRPQRGLAKAKRPERPSSLDLSSAGVSTDDVPLTENGSLSSSGEKIKRRVKTPYTLKKWRPASWVVSTDTALDLDLGFDHSESTSGQILVSSGAHIRGSPGVPKINQSKSSMAVFLVGGGATATTTAEPDGITSF